MIVLNVWQRCLKILRSDSMSKCLCLGCNGVFDEEEIVSWVERHNLDYGGEIWTGSPCCKDGYVETYECDACGEYITTDQYVEINDNKYCMYCATIKRLEEL